MIENFVALSFTVADLSVKINCKILHRAKISHYTVFGIIQSIDLSEFQDIISVRYNCRKSIYLSELHGLYSRYGR